MLIENLSQFHTPTLTNPAAQWPAMGERFGSWPTGWASVGGRVGQITITYQQVGAESRY